MIKIYKEREREGLKIPREIGVVRAMKDEMKKDKQM